MTIYEKLARDIEERIRNGTILAGQKLPSVRELSTTEEVSPTTVVDAYELLRSRGLIESRNRSGFFVSLVPEATLDRSQRTATLLPSAKYDPDEIIQAMKMATYDDRIFPFGAATPSPEFFPSKALQRTIRKVLGEEPHLMSEYRFPPGSPQLRDRISHRYQKFEAKFPLDAVVTTTGAIEAISLALQVVAKPGDIVAIESPCYFGIITLVRSLGYKILEIPMDPLCGLTPERVKDAFKKCPGKVKALVTISSFSNPLGTLVSDRDKEEIVALAAQEGTVIVEDDIYGDVSFGGERPRPYKAFDKWETVILCGSFSKTISPAFRVGFVCSKKYADALTLRKSSTCSGVSAWGEETLAAFLGSDAYEKHLRGLRSTYRTLIDQYSTAILAQFPEGTKLSRPQGGFVLWAQLPKGVDSRDLQRKGLQNSISVTPGTVFSVSGRDYANFIRMNCAITWSAPAQRAIGKLAQLIRSEEESKR